MLIFEVFQAWFVAFRLDWQTEEASDRSTNLWPGGRVDAGFTVVEERRCALLDIDAIGFSDCKRPFIPGDDSSAIFP